MQDDDHTARHADWFTPGSRAKQVLPAVLDAFGVRVVHRGRADELRELIAFATAAAMNDVARCVVSATHDAAGPPICTLTLRRRVSPADIERVRCCARLTLSCHMIAGDAEPTIGRTADHARALLPHVVRVGVHAFDPDDIARLATLAIDESGQPEDTAAVGALFDRMGARVSTIAQMMFDPPSAA
jgi:hypothetical protein